MELITLGKKVHGVAKNGERAVSQLRVCRPSQALSENRLGPSTGVVGGMAISTLQMVAAVRPSPLAAPRHSSLKCNSGLQACGLISPRTSAVCQEVVRARLPSLPKHSQLILPTLDA